MNASWLGRWPVVAGAALAIALTAGCGSGAQSAGNAATTAVGSPTAVSTSSGPTSQVRSDSGSSPTGTATPASGSSSGSAAGASSSAAASEPGSAVSASPVAGKYRPVKRPGAEAKTRVPGTKGTFAKAVRYSDGVHLVVTKVSQGVESGQGRGVFPGRHDSLVTLKLTNDSKKAIDLEQVVVQLTYGSPARVAAPVYDDSRTRDFGSIVKPGQSATAAYAFAVPVAKRGSVTMHVDMDGRHAVAVFTGSVK